MQIAELQKTLNITIGIFMAAIFVTCFGFVSGASPVAALFWAEAFIAHWLGDRIRAAG
jgi:hypothetical protein